MNRNTVLALGLLFFSIAIPLVLVYFVTPRGGGGELQLSGAAERGQKQVWLSTPAFTLKGSNGEKQTLVAALKMNNSEDAVRVCKYMPLVRDRINVMASQIEKSSQGKDVIESFERRRLRKALFDVLKPTGPAVVKFIDAKIPPSQAFNDAPSVICDGRRLDPTRSPLFNGS
ncbi:hypothetical protein EOI86_09465 [Hwanghaeella grinnelliae]|uniref:Uncharacterized protein n=1 Tax=Hwanghaeella grinnelliae TaxID=2500179 RepID=A0A3S3USD5_9PROT|nr:hypothetical protein [Hwanghaeella grinnelliae]RVU39443.1 hypothetical protein EOI86_09465 [Hwanghaeella grinnelliae]